MFPRQRHVWIGRAVALTVALAAHSAFAGEKLEGPYAATVHRVVDGDTLAARVTVWLGQELDVLVRVRGIDAPEIRGDCDSEERRALEATMALANIVGTGAVTLTAIEGDKFFGRVLADVRTPSGEDVAAALLAGAFARPYDGGARQGWCEIGAADGAEDQARAALAD